MAMAVFAFVIFLAFYNLGMNPATWRDEGGTLLLARTLAQDGVYSVKNFGRDGSFYESFGPVQSVGPTVVLPIAAVIKFRGCGLSQGRLVPAVYLAFSVVAFYFAGRALLGWKIALFSVVLIISSPTVQLVSWGRQALGDVPAFGFFIAGWIVWISSLHGRKKWLWPLAGLLMGAAIVTKTHFAIIGVVTLVLVAVADLFWYRQKIAKGLAVIAVVASVCVAAWWGWQLAYFGRDVFLENTAKMFRLAAVTGGFDWHMTVAAVKQLFGPQLGHFYYFWGVPALIYAGAASFRRDQQGLMTWSLLAFALVWLGYWLFWITPWKEYGLPAFAIVALFVGQLWFAIVKASGFSTTRVKEEICTGHLGRTTAGSAAMIMVVICVAYSLVWTLRNDVVKVKQTAVLSTAAYLDANVPRNSLIEIWDRELALMTSHRYHITDPMLLHNAKAPYTQDNNYAAGSEYFEKYRPDCVVVGPQGREGVLYDTEYLYHHSRTVHTIGDAEKHYDVYQLQWP